MGRTPPSHTGVMSILVVVGSQIANLTPGPSFCHNLCYICSNGSCEAIFNIYTSIDFQWHEEHLKARCFDPYNWTLEFWESRRTPKFPFQECECHSSKSGVVTLDICVVRMILFLRFNVLMCTMKLVGLAIVPIYQYLASISWNPLSIPLVVSSATFHPPIYKLEVLKCIMLFINFQIFQKPQSTWGTHSHPITKRMCRKSFKEMKDMVADEVYCTPIATSSAIIFSMNKTFLFYHLFNEDGQGPMELLKGEKQNQTLLKFAPMCFLGICNLIASLKHHLDNLISFYCIFKLKALFGYDYI